MADGYVFRNRIRVGIFAWWLLLGVMFGFFDPPSIPRIGGLLGLIVTAAGFAFKGIQEAQERRTLARLVAHQEAVDEVGTAANTIKQKAAIAAAQLETVAQEAALRLRQLAREEEHGVTNHLEHTAANTRSIAEDTKALRQAAEKGSPQIGETEP